MTGPAEGGALVGLWEIVGLAIALGADSFSVCLGLGMERLPKRPAAIGIVMGGAQGAFVVFGYLAALAIHAALHTPWILTLLSQKMAVVQPDHLHDELHALLTAAGALVLAGVGINLIVDFLRRDSARSKAWHGRGLVAVALSVNVDAISAGVALGMFEIPGLLLVAGITFGVGALLSWAGLRAGRGIGRRAGSLAQPVGGIILLIVALQGLMA